MRLGRQHLAAMLPHGDDMCLLDEVTRWDNDHIQCLADPGRADNPLREGDALGTTLLIEYAGQATALHGALLSDPNNTATPAYIGAVKNVEILRDYCKKEGRITLEATCVLQSTRGTIYDFTASQEHTPLIRGRLVINHTG